MKWLVCGGRDFHDEAVVFQFLDSLSEDEKPTHVIHGGAKGADALAGQWARLRGIQEVVCPAGWDVHGKRAGWLRNVAMAQLLNCGDDIVVAFPGGRGTQMMIDISTQEGIGIVYYTAP